jgi:hypothetical protein
MLCLLGAAVGLRGAVRGGVRGAGLGQTHASRTGRPILLAPEPSGFGIPERRVAQSAEQEITPAAEGPFDVLLYGAAAFVLTRGVAVPLFDFLGKLVDHGSLVSSPTLSNNLVCVGVLTCCACALIMVAAHMLVAAHSVHLFPLSRTEAADSSPPGLAELLSCVDSSDTLEAVAAWCKATGVNHVTDLVGREQTFAMELSNLMPPTKRDALLEALAAVSAKHVGVWTRSDQDEAVEALKVLALAERMFRQSSP